MLKRVDVGNSARSHELPFPVTAQFAGSEVGAGVRLRFPFAINGCVGMAADAGAAAAWAAVAAAVRTAAIGTVNTRTYQRSKHKSQIISKRTFPRHCMVRFSGRGRGASRCAHVDGPFAFTLGHRWRCGGGG